MPETTGTTPTPATLRECVVCGVRVIGGVAVALVESGSGPGRTLYACRGCVKSQSLLPLDEQGTLHGDGRLRYRAR